MLLTKSVSTSSGNLVDPFTLKAANPLGPLTTSDLQESFTCLGISLYFLAKIRFI